MSFDVTPDVWPYLLKNAEPKRTILLLYNQVNSCEQKEQ